MDFQLLSATLEDRYPPGYDCPKEQVAVAPSENRRVTVTKAKEGCVAFLFGRTEDGSSVALRQEGVFPRLYYKLEGGDTKSQLKAKLEQFLQKELSRTSGLRVVEREMTHGYAYEPDADSPSGRLRHRYAEVSFPNLASFRKVKNTQRDKDARKLRKLTTTYGARRDEISRMLTDASRRAMQGRVSDEQRTSDTEKYRTLEAEKLHITQTILPVLTEKIKLMGDDPEGGGADVGDTDMVGHPHEHFVEPMTRYFQEEGITPGRWYRFAMDRACSVPVTLCNREFHVSSGGLTPLEREDMSPYLTCYYDIETTGLDPATHPVIQISLVFEDGGGALAKHVVVLNTVDETLLPGIKCHVCNYEHEVLTTFARLIRVMDPDFVVAYNGVNFDNHFLGERATRCTRDRHDDSDFFYLSRFALRPSRLRELSLTSNGMGDNLFRYFDMPGRQNFDWFVKLKRDLTSEASYSLNHFARTICGDKKKEMDYREIPRLQNGSDADRSRLAEYCVHDSVLLARLNAARTMVIEIIQFSSVFGIIPEWVYFRGQQVRFVSQLLRRVRTHEEIPILLNVPPEGFVGASDFGKFTGATVNDPIVGFFKQPVLCVDWMSLYPSIMIGHNLCHSTHISRERIDEFVAKGWEVVSPSDAPKTDRAIVAHDIGDGRTTYFVSATVKRGILPVILEDQARQRKTAKALHKKYTKMGKDEAKKTGADDVLCARYHTLASVYDGQQKAIKTSMNSIYGACGAEAGKFPNRDISSTVTAEGRHAMVVKKKILPAKYPGVRVIYGDTDSIMMTFDDVTTLGQADLRGREVEVFINEHFASALLLPTMRIEFEKVFFPYLQQGKKRYAGRKYEPGCDAGDEMMDKGIDCKGLETERKDTLPFTREIMTTVFDEIMSGMDEYRALAHFEGQMKKLVRDEVPFEHYIMKKNLSAKVQGRADSIVQAKVNRDRREREPGSEAATGEQVEYVIVNGYKGEKTTQLAQDPRFAREAGMKPNRLWYFEHAIEEPVRKIFCAFPHIDFKRVCDGYRSILHSKRLNLGDSLQKVMRQDDGGGGGGSVGGEDSAPSVGYVPRPPAPRKKLRRK